ncbi:hypothetical protein CIRMBP1219_02466 [Enterococcus cecorum]|nr:hypothetical protein CIRMBP1219_02466 [Enterococcus cecorum]
MKLIEVMIKLANGEIKDQTTLKIYDHADTLYTYTFVGKYNSFYSNTNYRRGLGDYFKISSDFLNYDVELIPPKPKKYLVKVNIQGLHEDFAYLNYSELQSYVVIDSKFDFERCRTHFTKKEMQSIQPVREFLEDMQGKFELIEVEDNEIY